MTTQWLVQISRCPSQPVSSGNNGRHLADMLFSLCLDSGLRRNAVGCGHLTKIIAAFPSRALCISYPHEASGDLNTADPWYQDLSSGNLFMNFYTEGEDHPGTRHRSCRGDKNVSEGCDTAAVVSNVNVLESRSAARRNFSPWCLSACPLLPGDCTMSIFYHCTVIQVLSGEPRIFSEYLCII